MFSNQPTIEHPCCCQIKNDVKSLSEERLTSGMWKDEVGVTGGGRGGGEVRVGGGGETNTNTKEKG